jgi:phenylalanyl-tRNA synthetase beta chain
VFRNIGLFQRSLSLVDFSGLVYDFLLTNIHFVFRLIGFVMLVSWKWLSRYLSLSMDHTELAQRLSLSGLNHESTKVLDNDVVIDLEVTSNRGDCLGHLGVAREIAVLYDLAVKKPEPDLTSITDSQTSVQSLLRVTNEFSEACPRYIARLIRGVRIGASPAWMQELLASIGIASINNVVDATNFVMMECGQPLHAFDYAKLAGKAIRVRPANLGETLQAIDHRTYDLDSVSCVIADAQHAVAVAGVMGGATSEVSDATTDVVIEAASFTPLSVRRTARRLKLHSPSSYRFERRIDAEQLDWASRRVCELIVASAGGKVCQGVIDTAPTITERSPISLRQSAIERLLGLAIAPEDVRRILSALGCQVSSSTGDCTNFVPPSWRQDLVREVDLIEEVARIHGFEKIPEDTPIPVAPSRRRAFDVGVERIRSVLTSAGLSEAMTPSVVVERLEQILSPWTEKPPLQTQTPMLEGSRCLRRSLLPSLVQSRAMNWSSSNTEANLFEIAHVYLPGDAEGSLPDEHYTVGMIAGGDFFRLKGVVELLCERLGITSRVQLQMVERSGTITGMTAELSVSSRVIGYLAGVSEKVLRSFKLPGPVLVAELSLPTLFELSTLVPQQQPVSLYPSIERDLNFVVAENVRWNQLEEVARAVLGETLADVRYRETYRDTQKDGADRKRVLMTLQLQRRDATLSGEQADEMVTRLIGECHSQLGARLL